MRNETSKYLELCDSILQLARKRRVARAEVYHVRGRQTEVRVRSGKTELVKEAVSQGVGLRLLRRKRQGFASTTDLTVSGLTALLDEALAASDITEADRHLGLPTHTKIPNRRLQIHDTAIDTLTMDRRIEQAKVLEAAARGADRRITGMHETEWSDGESMVTLLNTNGLSGHFATTGFSLSCAPVAGRGANRQTGYWYDYKRNLAALDSPETVGNKAAERTLRKLGARKVKSGQYPIVFDPQAAAGLLGSLLSALNGESVLRRRSFFCDRLTQQVASKLVTVIDDGMLRGGLSTRPFDGEGVATSKKALIQKGRLKRYLYNTYTARRAGVQSTGNATRSYSSIPGIGCQNFYLQAGNSTPEAIIGSVDRGLLVTGMMGHGLNPVTGDFSRGAEGLWIEKGQIKHAVQGVTIAGNLLKILQQIEMVGNDLEFRSGVASPTILVRQMTVSGK
jgi:PmbA protein